MASQPDRIQLRELPLISTLANTDRFLVNSGTQDYGATVATVRGIVDLSGVISKVSSPTAGNFAVLTSDGSLQNSSFSSTSFAPISHTQGSNTITNQSNVSGSNITVAINNLNTSLNNLSNNAVTGIDAGTGISVVDGSTATPEVRLNINSLSNTPLNTLTDTFPVFDTSANGIGKATISQINHDQLTNFVDNEHINHSSVSIVAGAGLSGGGNITTSRTISLDTSFTDNRYINNTSSDMNFLRLFDTPSSYSGSANRLVRVNSSANGIEFYSQPTSENIDHNNVSIVAGAGLSGGGNITTSRTISLDTSFTDNRYINNTSSDMNFLRLFDSPSSYSGNANRLVRVNSGATGLEFYQLPNYLTSVSAGSLIDISGSAPTQSISVDLSELIELTTTPTNTQDSFVILDNGVQRRVRMDRFKANNSSSADFASNSNALDGLDSSQFLRSDTDDVLSSGSLYLGSQSSSSSRLLSNGSILIKEGSTLSLLDDTTPITTIRYDGTNIEVGSSSRRLELLTSGLATLNGSNILTASSRPATSVGTGTDSGDAIAYNWYRDPVSRLQKIWGVTSIGSISKRFDFLNHPFASTGNMSPSLTFQSVLDLPSGVVAYANVASTTAINIGHNSNINYNIYFQIIGTY